ncbi:hypothetical protein [Melghirimyces algeriensis]|uniref:Uncharacterized protein n=1 Tax=Melghirimyces algeriensis TaxID=910412 RepID=A0A521DXM9_9BACL|nr:hypothetical protein [Melghirimyces algeriensis]SMO76467.1 hypothetical protein SAMN06264849_10757 [Melghirimyces algeriensis]
MNHVPKEDDGLHKAIQAFKLSRYLKESRFGFFLLLFSLLGTLIGIGWLVSREPTPVYVLKEATFQKVVPYFFKEDRFYFWGQKDKESGYYIFDLKSEKLIKEDWTHKYGDSKGVYRVGKKFKVRINDKKSERSLMLEGHQTRKKISGSLPLLKKPVSVSPAGNFFVYAEQAESGLNLHLYIVEAEKDILLNKEVEPSKVSGEQWVQWSAEGEYFLIDHTLYRSKDGKPVKKLDGHAAVWAPDGARLVYVESPKKQVDDRKDSKERPFILGTRLMILDMESGKLQRLYETEAEQWIVGKAVWDPSGRYVSFPTGKKINEETYFEKVHVTDGKMFHYTENEQNLMPTRLNHLTLSPNGDYLSYAVNGILKLIDLRTQESKVYDVYHQVQSDPDYVRFDPKGVWLVQNREILFVADNMEEKRVYQTDKQVLGFNLSSQRKKLLVREESKEGQILRLVDLKKSQDVTS